MENTISGAVYFSGPPSFPYSIHRINPCDAFIPAATYGLKINRSRPASRCARLPLHGLISIMPGGTGYAAVAVANSIERGGKNRCDRSREPKTSSPNRLRPEASVCRAEIAGRRIHRHRQRRLPLESGDGFAQKNSEFRMAKPPNCTPNHC